MPQSALAATSWRHIANLEMKDIDQIAANADNLI